ncbi:MAG TPA: LysM domain-containing protein [Planctomycetota bacterium]|nr:LysM domain-containing protein [Planctomycetota bacterium]
MGQLEKYGLYVLCLVIFLILGVTIWGGGELPVSNKQVSQAPIVAPGAGAAGGPAGSVPAGNAAKGTKSSVGDIDLDALFGPAPNGKEKKGDAKAADASAAKPAPGGAGGADARGKPNEPAKPPAADAERPTYKIKARDTFEGIAREKLGNAALHPLITRLNPGVEPTKLQVGDEIRLPTAAEIAQLTARPEPKGAPATKARDGGGTYRVKKGDTFEGIALSQLGSRSRVAELRELNPTVEPTKLHIGDEIRLPK